MNCRTAQERLDVVPAAALQGEHESDAELQLAVEHLHGCDECRSVVQQRRRFDAAVKEVMPHVPVPAGLQDRIFERLAAERSESSAANGEPVLHSQAAAPLRQPADQSRRVPEPARGRMPRRLVAGIISSAAVLVAAVAIWHSLSDASPTVALNDIRSAVASWPRGDVGTLELTALETFDGSFPPALQDQIWQKLVETPARGVDLDSDGDHDIAVYEFSVRRIRGFVVALPAETVVDAPTVRYPAGSHSAYSPLPSDAWSQGDQVLMVFVERGQLETLRQTLYGSSV